VKVGGSEASFAYEFAYPRSPQDRRSQTPRSNPYQVDPFVPVAPGDVSRALVKTPGSAPPATIERAALG